ncbi:hypothetical protein Salat_2918200 [Sesamum alatum]|uniref:Myb/SANT-like domain-containing protein n=1 Tax=Sesamum alatum TaxID=300844 RepID=A0AAE1XIR0_9LAMI|nr:hypothetical protein Salat_2918200 [Sesamum alatum]
MWLDGFYYQQRDFYSSRWSKDMERSFVHFLVDLRKGGIFHRGEENVDAICAALQDVNRKHSSKVVYSWAMSCEDTLQELHEVFRWVAAYPGIVWNKNLKFLVAEDRIWKALLLVSPAAIDLNAPPPEEAVGDGSPKNPKKKADMNDVVFISDSSDSSSSFWGYIEELLGSDSNADSVLPPPGVPTCVLKKKIVMLVSPSSFHSVGENSSLSTNPTPKKKGT